MGWTAMEDDVWDRLVERLPRPLTEDEAGQDLRVHQRRLAAPGSRTAVRTDQEWMARWGWGEGEHGRRRVRRLRASPDLWGCPLLDDEGLARWRARLAQHEHRYRRTPAARQPASSRTPAAHGVHATVPPAARHETDEADSSADECTPAARQPHTGCTPAAHGVHATAPPADQPRAGGSPTGARAPDQNKREEEREEHTQGVRVSAPIRSAPVETTALHDHLLRACKALLTDHGLSVQVQQRARQRESRLVGRAVDALRQRGALPPTATRHDVAVALAEAVGQLAVVGGSVFDVGPAQDDQAARVWEAWRAARRAAGVAEGDIPTQPPADWGVRAAIDSHGPEACLLAIDWAHRSEDRRAAFLRSAGHLHGSTIWRRMTEYVPMARRWRPPAGPPPGAPVEAVAEAEAEVPAAELAAILSQMAEEGSAVATIDQLIERGQQRAWSAWDRGLAEALVRLPCGEYSEQISGVLALVGS